VLAVASGSAVEDVVEALLGAPGVGRARVLRVSAASLLRLLPCGFRAETERRAFEAAVMRHAFGGMYVYICIYVYVYIYIYIIIIIIYIYIYI
jgi:hypothetical protein